MRIRNRPAPSIFPPPPDLNLNRSFPPPQPQQVVLVQEPPDDDDANHYNHLASTPRRDNRPLCVSSGEGIALDLPSDQLPLATYSLRRSGKVTAKRSYATASSDNHDNDDDNNIIRKGTRVEETEVHLFSHTKVDYAWNKGGKAVIPGDAEGKGKIEKEASGGIVNKGAAVKRGSRVGASAMMEGSRCSRVNGRGWRCGQQTLVGYSLCEHHLGKSRLRSLSSVKNIGTSKRERVGEEISDTDDEALLVCRRKKSRIGTVKARSLSSLLGQTSQANGVAQPSSSAGKGNAADK